MQKQSFYKIPGGKSISITLDYDYTHTTDTKQSVLVVKNILLAGDFFLHPEEKLQDLENYLTKHCLDADLTESLSNFIKKNSITLIGFSKQDITHALQDILNTCTCVGA